MRFFFIALALLFATSMHAEDASYDYQIGSVEPFYSLSLTSKDQERIFKLISNMGTLSWPKLLLKKREMEKIGDQIDSVHPMRFLGAIFSNPHLAQCMQSIYSSSLIRRCAP